MVKYITENNYNVKLQKLHQEQTPCALFYYNGDCSRESVRQATENIRQINLNLKCIVLPCLDEGYAEINGLPVVALHEFDGRKTGAEFVLIYTEQQFRTMYEVFTRQGLETMILRNTSTMSLLYDWIINRLPDLYDAYSLLKDEDSKRTFLGFLTASHATANMADYIFAPELQYFLRGFMPTVGDIAIDGGAYDGATARDFTELGAKVYAFELDSKNYAQCVPSAQKYGFTIENLGLADKKQRINYSPLAASSRMAEQGTAQGEVIDLDSYVREHDLPRVDYIKLDIEGAELSALHGARQSISKWKPKMAISLYHNPDDLHQIIPFIHSLRPDYEFVCRHYRTDCHNYWLTPEQRDLFRQNNLSLDIALGLELILYCR